MTLRLLATGIACGLLFQVGAVGSGQERLSLVVLVDVSGSMLPLPARYSYSRDRYGIDPRDIRRGIERLAALQRTGDRFRVGHFGGGVVIRPLPQEDRTQLRSVLDSVSEPAETDRHGPSALWDALVTAVEVLETEPPHRSVLLITDGRATGNRIGHEEAIRRASLAGVTVSVIAPLAVREIPLDGDRVLSVDPGVFLRRLTEGTGGVFMPFGPGERSVVPLIERGVRDLRRRQPDPESLIPDPTSLIPNDPESRIPVQTRDAGFAIGD